MAKLIGFLSFPMTQKNRLHQSSLPFSARIADRIPAPDVFLRRLRRAGFVLPENVFIVCRRSAKHLPVSPLNHDFHHHWLLAIPLMGSGTMIVNGSAFPLQPSQTMLVPPLHLHRYINVSGRRILWLFILSGSTGAEFTKPERGQLSAGSRRILDEVVELWLDEKPDAANCANLVMKVALLLFSIRQATPIEENSEAIGRDVELLGRVNQWLESNRASPGSLTDLAVGIGQSESHLRAVFRNHFGLSLGRYVRETRCRLAALRLQEGHLSVSQVADECGFTSVYAFSRTFKQVIGVAPSTLLKH